MAGKTEPKQTSQIQEGPGQKEKEQERLAKLEEPKIDKILSEVRDFLEECCDRLDNNGQDLGYCEILVKNSKGRININIERSISIYGTPKSKWSD